jgi:tetratricopeptide (TPR) repeat protein
MKVVKISENSYFLRKRLRGVFLRLHYFLIILVALTAGCAYYNTLFNAKKSYNEGIKAVGESSEPSAAARKHFETTIDKCWKLIELYSDKSKYADDALLYISKSEYYLERYPQAKLHLEQFMKKYPDSKLLSEAQLWYAKVHLKEEEIESANEYFLLVINNSKDAKLRAEANLSLGVYAFENQNYDQSIDYLERALKEKLDDEYKAGLLYYLGEDYYTQEDYENAIDYYKRVDKFKPTPDVEYRSKLNLARSYTAMEKYNQADRILKKMLTAPRFQTYLPTIKAAIGENYERQDKIEDAVDIYREVVRERKSNPGTAQAAFDLAKIFENVYHDIDSAVVYYGKVSQLYSKFDSVKVANEKKQFLSEFKEIRDQINYDAKLTFRLNNEPGFRDSLYQAQYEDSINQALGIAQANAAAAVKDSLKRLLAYRDSVALGLIDTTAQAQADSLQQNPDSLLAQQQQQQEDIFKGFRNTLPEENTAASTPGQTDTAPKNNQQDTEKKPLEKRKLPQIEFDLMNNRYHLAEFYLLKVQDYDSAAYHYNKFLETYEDSILTPKALYSLIYIHKSKGHEDPQKVEALEEEILEKYPDSIFAIEIKKSRGLLREQKTLTPEQEAENLFAQAESLYFAGNYSQSIDTYQYIASLDTTWMISAKAQYATAWIYEHNLAMKDSALAAYKMIIEHYPSAAEFVKVARKKTTPIAAGAAVAAGDTIATTTAAVQDSLHGGPAVGVAASEFGLGSEDILKEKILWRNRREKLGLDQIR